MNKKIKEIIEALEFMCKTGDVSKIALESLKNGLEELAKQLILSGVVKSFTADFQINDNVTFKQNRSGKVTDVYENELQIKGINGNYKTICKTDVIEKH